MPSRKPPSPGLVHNPFAAAFGVDPAHPSASEAQPAPERAVLRYERKGRAGKEVTVIEALGLPERAMAEWLRELKGTLGCGGTLEGPTIVLQGDQRKRARAWLLARGIAKVTG